MGSRILINVHFRNWSEDNNVLNGTVGSLLRTESAVSILGVNDFTQRRILRMNVRVVDNMVYLDN